MKLTAALTAVCLFAAPVFAQNAPKPSALTEDQKTLYALGVWLASKVSVFQLKSSELRTVERGLEDAINERKLVVDLDTYGNKINDLAHARMQVSAAKQKKADESFVEKVKTEKGARVMPSGLIFIPVKEGTGAVPAASDTVKVHYEGRLTNGKVFDSSVARGEPAEFPLNGVIPCWTEGVQLMKVGGKARLICPSAIAYGDNGRPPTIPGGATLDFTVEFLDIVPAKK